MRSQLWIINSALIALFVMVVLVLMIGRPSLVLPKKIDLAGRLVAGRDAAMPSIDTTYIYQHDPFGTLSGITPPEPVVPPKPMVAPLPAAPMMGQDPQHASVIPAFLPPLTVVLKGIIYGSQEHDHRAIIEDKKTRKEGLYRVGDTILDAEIIRIESNKIMFLRSNGQQETVYVSSAEAHKDPLYQRAEGKYAAVIPVRKVSDTQFVIDPHLFVLYINNLAQFLDALDITTVFEKGRSIGCRIGAVAPNSIGALCGLQSSDIVTTINDISTGTTKERLAIYQQIIGMQEGSTIKVSLLRGTQRQPVDMTYTLSLFTPPRVAPVQNAMQQPAPVFQNSQRSNASIPGIKNSNNMDKVVEKMRKNDKRAMVNYGGKSMAQRSTKR